MRDAPRRIESITPNARSTASTSTNEPIRVSASCGSPEKMPVVSSRLEEVTIRFHDSPGWLNNPGTTRPYTAYRMRTMFSTNSTK